LQEECVKEAAKRALEHREAMQKFDSERYFDIKRQKERNEQEIEAWNLRHLTRIQNLTLIDIEALEQTHEEQLAATETEMASLRNQARIVHEQAQRKPVTSTVNLPLNNYPYW